MELAQAFTGTAIRDRVRTAVAALHTPVDGASTAFLRIAFGLVMVWEVTRFFRFGWIERYYIDPTFHFTYPFFEWVRPWPGDLMYVHFAVLGVLGGMIAIGLFYRVAALLFAFGFTYVFLLDSARYLNHFYLVVILAFMLAAVPAHRTWSLDGRLGVTRVTGATGATGTVPRWALWVLRAQIGLVFFFGGVAKLNGDWLRGEPMRMWLADRTDFPLIGRWFTEGWAPYAFSYGGLLLDLFVIPFILWRKTRWLAYFAALTFHLTNSQLFTIGIFPWLMIGAMLIFFEPDWPRFRALRSRLGYVLPAPPAAGARPPARLSRAAYAVVAVAAAWIALQSLAPLRHHLYPGPVSWTEEGHQFAWHMKLRDKEGDTYFVARDPGSGEQASVDPTAELAWWQYSKMVTRPDMILEYAHHLARRFAAEGRPGVEVHAISTASLNDREAQLMVDPEVDLARERRTIFGYDWVVPLDS